MRRTIGERVPFRSRRAGSRNHALLVFRVAIGATQSGGLAARDVAPAFLLGVVGSVVFGYAIARVYFRISNRVEDTPSWILLQFIGTFGVWIVADRLRLSPVLTLVAFAITLARRAPDETPARRRRPSAAPSPSRGAACAAW